MEVADAHKVLRVLQANWCQYPNAQGLPEDTVELYLRMLSETNARGEHLRLFADAMEAARHWVLGEDHFPLVGELLEAIQREARKRAASSVAGQLPPAWQGLDPEDLPPPELPVGSIDEGTRLSNVQRLREVLRSAQRPTPRATPEERARTERRPPEPCSQHDHSLCGAGPVLARPKVQ